MENTTTTKIAKITPKIVYDAYPGSDLLPIDPPQENESFTEYRARVKDKNLIDCGDTLFAFLIFELTHADDTTGAMRLLQGALNDIVAIYSEISKRC